LTSPVESPFFAETWQFKEPSIILKAGDLLWIVNPVGKKSVIASPPPAQFFDPDTEVG
jgi:hypothetical protein